MYQYFKTLNTKKNCPKDFHKFISKQFRDVASGEGHFLSQQRSFVKFTYKDVNYDGVYPRFLGSTLKKKEKNSRNKDGNEVIDKLDYAPPPPLPSPD